MKLRRSRKSARKPLPESLSNPDAMLMFFMKQELGVTRQLTMETRAPLSNEAKWTVKQRHKLLEESGFGVETKGPDNIHGTIGPIKHSAERVLNTGNKGGALWKGLRWPVNFQPNTLTALVNKNRQRLKASGPQTGSEAFCYFESIPFFYPVFWPTIFRISWKEERQAWEALSELL